MELPHVPEPDREYTPFRRIHERPEDIENENRMQRIVESRTGWSLVYLPNRKFRQIRFKMVGVDANDMVARADIKCRSNKHDKYRTYKTASWKWDLAIRYHALTGVNTFFFIWFDDGPYFIKSDRRHRFRRSIWGRREMRDDLDANPTIDIPINLLTKLEDWPHDTGPVRVR